MERRLYDTDPYCGAFSAEVTSCEQVPEGYRISLNPAGFYPGGGGNPADTGTISGFPILSADEHSCTYVIAEKLAVGSIAECVVDMEHRMDYMRQHTAEHIVSGILYTMTGGDNVGFHMSDEAVTVDWSVELTAEQLAECEYRANLAAMENRAVTVTVYPETPDIFYRAKKEIAGDIRIVTIDGIDSCACCAMHVQRTGEVGQIRILDFMRWRGGTRLTMVAGTRSLRDARTVAEQNREIGRLVSAKPYETAAAVRQVLDISEELKLTNSALRKRVNDLRAQTLESVTGKITLFEDELNPEELRHLVLKLSGCRRERVAVFTGSDKTGYRYAIAAQDEDVRVLTKELNKALNGRGGGTAVLTQGSVKASRTEIKAFLQ